MGSIGRVNRKIPIIQIWWQLLVLSQAEMVPNRISKLQNTLKVIEILSPIAVTWEKQ